MVKTISQKHKLWKYIIDVHEAEFEQKWTTTTKSTSRQDKQQNQTTKTTKIKYNQNFLTIFLKKNL